MNRKKNQLLSTNVHVHVPEYCMSSNDTTKETILKQHKMNTFYLIFIVKLCGCCILGAIMSGDCKNTCMLYVHFLYMYISK